MTLLFSLLLAGISLALLRPLTAPTLARLPKLSFTRRRGGIRLAGMPVSRDDLRTSILVTGVTGSAKTAGILMPALAQLFRTYNQECGDALSPNPLQKLGAFIPEVKGDLVDGCIYLAAEAGRCVSRDVIVISPSCRIPVVRYRDELGRRWHLSGRGGAGGSDAGDLLPRTLSPAVFEEPAALAAAMPALAGAAIALGGQRPRFLGWRWENRRLCRAGPAGESQWADPPETLAIDGVDYVDNGVHFNLVDPRLPAAEAAERLTRLAAMSRRGGTGGENDYFYEQGRKLIAACIALHRATETAPCTAVDIVRLATQEQRLERALAALQAKLERLAEAEAACSDGEARRELRLRQYGPLEDLALYFRDEWLRMVADGKTANVIKSTISGAFDAFLQDPNLAETFCQPSTFSFEDVVQSGKIIALVPGDRYEQLGRLLGTACKLDFQSAMLARNSRPDLNSARLALYFADECHKYVISGSSSAGDPYFMNLSRSNNVVNICATQSYAWIVEVIGREAANVYISAFGVQFWLQQTDPETCRRASEMCGSITRERAAPEFAPRRVVRDEERPRHPSEEFAQLDVGEVIAYNKGRRGRLAKVAKGRVAYSFCTKRPEGLAAVNARVREYYRDVLENLARERGQFDRWNLSPMPCPPSTSPLPMA